MSTSTASPRNVSEKQDYNPWLEVFRLAALLLLVAYHTSLIAPAGDRGALARLAASGWVGTDLFLCLAGFLAARSLLAQPPGGATFRRYWAGRAFRIVPAYFVFLAVYLHTGPWFIDLIGRGWVLSPGVEPSLWTFTWNLVLTSGASSGVALEGLFALSVGVQLLVLAALLLCSVRKLNILAPVLVAAEVLAVVLRCFPFSEEPLNHYFFTLTRMDAFLAGLLLAVLLSHPGYRTVLLKYRTLILGAAAVFLGVVAALTHELDLWGGSLISWLPYPFLALFMGSLVLWVQGRKFPRALRWAEKAGALTYSAYLWKLPMVYLAFTLMRNLPPFHGEVGFLVSLALCSVLVLGAGALWRAAVERPLALVTDRLRSWWRNRSTRG